jgi:hypothetical protein
MPVGASECRGGGGCGAGWGSLPPPWVGLYGTLSGGQVCPPYSVLVPLCTRPHKKPTPEKSTQPPRATIFRRTPPSPPGDGTVLVRMGQGAMQNVVARGGVGWCGTLVGARPHDAPLDAWLPQNYQGENPVFRVTFRRTPPSPPGDGTVLVRVGQGPLRNVVARGEEPGLVDRDGRGWALVWQESLGDSQPGAGSPPMPNYEWMSVAYNLDTGFTYA